MAQIRYWLWLSSQTEISPKSKAKIVEHYSDAERAFFSPDGDFFNVPGITEHDARILEGRSLDIADKIMGECERLGITVIAINDSSYPIRLRNIPCPPVVLYVKGRLPDTDTVPAVAVIGTRSATPYGIKMAGKLSHECEKSGAIIISTLSRGIDEHAARAALRAGGKVIGVLGTPISESNGPLCDDISYYGALVSEYPPGAKTMRHFFRDRNRIAAGLCCGVVITEAPEISGTLLFAADAFDQGREIFAVPGNVDSPNSVGTNSLIKQGAKPVTCGWDVMEEFEFIFPGKVSNPITAPYVDFVTEKPDVIRDSLHTNNVRSENNISLGADHSTEKAIDKDNDDNYIDIRKSLSGLNDEQLRIVSVIGKDGTHIDDIITESGLNTAKVLAQLTILEIKGIVKRSAGRRIFLNTAKK